MFLFIFCHFSTLKITNWAYVTSNGMSYLQEPELKEQYVISKLRKIRRFAFVSSGRFELYFEQWKDLEGTSFFLSSSPTLHGAVCVYTQNLFIQIKPRFAAVRVGNEMYQRHLTTVSKAMFQYFCMLRLPYGALHFLLEEPTMHIIVFYFGRLPTTRAKCRAFTERLCPPGPATQQL